MTQVVNGRQEELEELKHERFVEMQIPVPWGHVSAKWWGALDVQPIIALHGWQDNSGTFDPLAPILAKRGLSLLCIDLPGHGLSSHIPEGQFYYIFWDGLLTLRRVVKNFNWNQISVIGHSLGGAIAFLYASVYPDEIKKYVSIDIASPSVRDPKKMVALVGKGVDKFLSYEKLTIDKMPCYEYDEMIQLVFEAYNNSVNRDACKIMMKRGMKPAPHRSDGFIFTRDPRLKLSSMGFMTIDQVMEFAKCIKCEVMNIRANPGLKFDNPEHYGLVLDTIEKTAKKLERHIVEGTHHLHLNDPHSVAGLIYDFMA